MPFFKAGNKLVYYAHVPKCGGTAVAYYLQDRFGSLGLYDSSFHQARKYNRPWSRTSPQHIDAASIETIIPISFFDAIFSVVRHPVPRTVSTYHFQREVEGCIPEDISFSDWLIELETTGFTPFEYDNHVLPMSKLVPRGGQVFYLEHGLDPIVIWLDELTGLKSRPRTILPENTRGGNRNGQSKKVVPTEDDIDRIGRLYSEDFDRFGYEPRTKLPKTNSPELTKAFISERDRELRTLPRLTSKVRRKLRQRLSRL